MTSTNEPARSDVRSSATEPDSGWVPYAPSLLNRFFSAVERLPGGGWWIYPLMFVALGVYLNGMLWLSGSRPVGSWSVDGIAGMAYGPYTIALSHYVLRVADRAISTFRRASGLSDAAYARSRYELIVIPAGRIWLPALVGSLFGVGSILSASTGSLAPYGGTTASALLVLGPGAIFGYGMVTIVAYQTFRQLREVDRLHRNASAVDLFDTAPIYAFSRLTVLIGSAYVIAAYYALIVNGSYQAGNAFALPVVAGTATVGVICFILPLWGIHGRLAAEKAALVRDVSARAKTLQQHLYERVDASNLTGVKDVTDALGGINATRDQIAKLPTWPWPPQLLRGFISAILLPVVVYLITRYVGAGIR